MQPQRFYVSAGRLIPNNGTGYILPNHETIFALAVAPLSCIGNLDVRTRYEEAVAAMAIVDVAVIIARARPPYSHAQVQVDHRWCDTNGDVELTQK